jgi:mannose-6-phosphate isomerase
VIQESFENYKNHSSKLSLSAIQYAFVLTRAKHKSPWGTWEVLEDEDSYKVKKIVMKTSHRLSYQRHLYREENWFIVQGKAKVTLDDKEQILESGDFIHIPKKSKHRIENIAAKEDLIFIEIQRGSYFGEDDIERFQDDYGRN